MTRKHTQTSGREFMPFWSITTAGAFVDAVEAASSARQSVPQATDKRARVEPAARRENGSLLPAGTPLRVALASAVIALCCITAIAWTA